MLLTFKRLIVTLCLVMISCHIYSQKKFFDIVKAAYDSINLKKDHTALALLLQAKALEGIDVDYNESVNLYIGNCYQAIGKIDSCIYFYEKAIRYYEDKNDSVYLCYLFNRLGSVELGFTKRYDKALAYYKRQIVYEVHQTGNISLTRCQNNIGTAFKLLGNYDSALHYFNIVLSNGSTDEQQKNKALRLIADIYSFTGNYKKAYILYDEAIRGSTVLKDSIELFVAYTNRGQCLLLQHKYPESLPSFKLAQYYITDSITDNQRKDLYHILAGVYRHLKNFKDALYYKNLESDIKDNINTDDINRAAANATADAEAKYETRKNKDSLIISQQKLKLKDKESADRKNQLVAVLISALIVCLIAFLALRNATIRKKANVKLAAQKAKVEALAADLEEANQTKARLFSVISHDLRSPVSSLYASLKMQELKGGNEKNNDAVSSHIMHLLDTLEDLLTWSKSQMDRFTLQPVTLRITDLYDDLIELHQDAAASKQITIENKAERQIKIYTDENLLKTILRNVLANSINHAPNKSTVVVDAVACEDGVVCTVSNEATATDAATLEARLQTAAIGSSKHGLGNVLIKEFTAKLNAGFEVAYRDGKVYLQIRVFSMPNAPQGKVIHELHTAATVIS